MPCRYCLPFRGRSVYPSACISSSLIRSRRAATVRAANNRTGKMSWPGPMLFTAMCSRTISATSASIFIRRCSPFLVYCRVRNRFPSGWNSAVTSTVDLLTVSMHPSKSKSSGMNEISSQYRAPVDTPSRAKTLAGWCGSAA